MNMYPSYSMNSNMNPNFFPNSIPHKDDTFFHQEPHLGQDHTFFLHQQIHDHDLFLHQPPPPAADPHPVSPNKINPRSLIKKDRHSKINTAKGPRDRRMRLSLDIARKFFDLQDLLGFDKASKTIEWLLLKSTAAINEVSSNHSPNSDVGNYNMDVSSVVDGNRQKQKQVLLKEKGSKGITGNSRERNKNHAFSRKSAYDPMAKESRKAARERAKERTREKNSTTIDAKGFGLWSPFDTSKDSHVNIIHPNHQDQLQVHQQQPVDQHPDIFTYDHHQNLHGHSNQQRHYGEYGNIAAKTWEAYSSMNLW